MSPHRSQLLALVAGIAALKEMQVAIGMQTETLERTLQAALMTAAKDEPEVPTVAQPKPRHFNQAPASALPG